MNQPLISIIIPLYNAERYVATTIRVAIDQTWPEKEIIIVDDESSDDSANIAERFVNDRIKLVRVKKGGAARARNIGLLYAKGRFIQFLDADDLIPKDKLESQMKLLMEQSEPDKCIVGCRWIRFRDSIDNVIGGVGPGGAAENDLLPADWLVMRPYNLQLLHGWLTPRRLIDAAGPWDESMTLDDDGEFFSRVVACSAKVLFCKETLVYYRMSESAPTLSFFSKFDSNQANCAKLESSLRSAFTFKRVLIPFAHPRGQEAIGQTFLYLAYSAYLVCESVFQESISQPEVPRIQRLAIYRLVGGRVGLLYLLVGWRLGKRIMRALGSR